MLNETMINNIREAGIAQGAQQVEDRMRLLEHDFGFRMADKAEYVVLASCFNPYLEPDDMKAFRKLLDYYDIDYTLIPREYCCGDPLYLKAIKDNDQQDLKQADELAAEFLGQNLKQIRQVGASGVIIYCAGCDMVWERLGGLYSEEILWHPTLINRLFQGGKLELQADYYAGCHKNRLTLNNTLPDLDSALASLSRIEGLELNHLDSSLCCTKPDQVETLYSSLKHKTLISPCPGCTLFLRQALKDRGDYQVFMPSTIIWAAINGSRPGENL